MFHNPLIDAIVVIVIVLLIMGPKRLPQLGRGLGHGMREFKEGITGGSKDEDENPPLTESRSAAASSAAAPRDGATGADRPVQPTASSRDSAASGSEPRA